MRSVLWIAVGLLLFYIISTWVVAWIIFKNLVLRPKHGWGRQASMPDDTEYMRLYEDAIKWRNENIEHKQEVEISNEGYRLCGEYFDFGFDRAVIIIPGRMESCHYSCHYAEPYKAKGFNVLTIDGRAHGLSDGKVNSLGYREFSDIIKWAEFLKQEKRIKYVVLHGVCIGSSTAIFAVTSDNCPDYIKGIVIDGAYQRFYDSYMNHLITDHRPRFPLVTPEVMLLMRVISKADVVRDGPYYRIDKLSLPVQFLHSREDIFSTPDKAQGLFDKCGSKQKAMHWFEHGAHSRLRVNNRQEYDKAINDYLEEYFG